MAALSIICGSTRCNGLEKWDRFSALQEKALQIGGVISVPSKELLQALENKVSVTLDVYERTPAAYEVRKLKYYCIKWSHEPTLTGSKKELWSTVCPSPPILPKAISTISIRCSPSERTFCLDPKDINKEKLISLCRQMHSLQLKCLEEGYSLDVPSREICQAAFQQLEEWTKRGSEEYVSEWKSIIKDLNISFSELEIDNNQTSPDGSVTQSTVSTPIQSVLHEFADYFLSMSNRSSIQNILVSVDSKLLPLASPLTDCSPSASSMSTSCPPPAAELINQLQLAQYENETLKAHLKDELGKLKKENEELKRKLDVQHQHSRADTPELHVPEAVPEAHLPDTCVSEAPPDEMVKLFSSLPKQLDTFYIQMEQGTEKLPKFSELPPIYKKSKRTKGAYSKRKAIYTFISNSGGIEQCLKNYSGLSPLQLYDQYIKKTRES